MNKDFLRRTFKNTSGTMYEAYLQDIDQSLDQDNGVSIKQRDRKALWSRPATSPTRPSAG